LNRGGQAEAALVPLREALRRFKAMGEAGEQMASFCLTELGDCLRNLGRLDDAAGSYQQAIDLDAKAGRDRDVAVGKGQLGTVRMHQRRYRDALDAHADARQTFAALGEPASVATAWHHTGMVYWALGNYQQAEQSYRQSLALRVKHRLRVDEASSLSGLGDVYDAMGRLEDAVTSYRQAAEIAVEQNNLIREGMGRSNLADILIKLDHLDQARTELERAIDCKKPFGHAAEFWTTRDILHKLEQADGNPGPAAAAREQAIAAYAAYRRDGGENQSGSATPKLCDQVAEAIATDATAPIDDGDPVPPITRALAELAVDPDLPAHLQALIPKLQAILEQGRAAGQPPGLADDPALDYDDAAELRLLLERLA
jgi:tetratricopeptide (TPR) repeat protein